MKLDLLPILVIGIGLYVGYRLATTSSSPTAVAVQAFATTAATKKKKLVHRRHIRTPTQQQHIRTVRRQQQHPHPHHQGKNTVTKLITGGKNHDHPTTFTSTTSPRPILHRHSQPFRKHHPPSATAISHPGQSLDSGDLASQTIRDIHNQPGVKGIYSDVKKADVKKDKTMRNIDDILKDRNTKQAKEISDRVNEFNKQFGGIDEHTGGTKTFADPSKGEFLEGYEPMPIHPSNDPKDFRPSFWEEFSHAGQDAMKKAEAGVHEGEKGFETLGEAAQNYFKGRLRTFSETLNKANRDLLGKSGGGGPDFSQFDSGEEGPGLSDIGVGAAYAKANLAIDGSMITSRLSI